MKHSEPHNPQVHDLLQIHWAPLGSEPLWVRQAMLDCPWVVVRRARAAPEAIAIGVRGHSRSERWAASCRKAMVREIVRPEDLLPTASDTGRTPALRVLQEMSQRWAHLTLPWGPAGSVGFELASGRMVTTEASDLDLVLRARQRMGLEEARFLLHCTLGLEAKVDIRVETPACGFSLEDYVTASSKILLRYPDAVRLGEDPWREEA